MEIVNFNDRTFGEIPNQDNPAFDKHECIMIVLSGELESKNNGAKYSVLHIQPTDDPYNEETVTRKGMFWEMEDAHNFAVTFQVDRCNFCGDAIATWQLCNRCLDKHGE